MKNGYCLAGALILAVGATCLVPAPALAETALHSAAVVTSVALLDEVDQPDEGAEGLEQSLILFEPVLAERSDLPGGVLEAQFEVPDGCAASTEDKTIACNGLTYNFDYTVMQDDGSEVPYSIAANDGFIYLRNESPQISGELTFSLLATEAIEAGVSPSAIHENFMEMMEEDARPYTDREVDDDENMLNDETAEYIPFPVPVTSRPPGGIITIPNSAAKRGKKVGIPAKYKYCTSWKTAACKPKSLHDYCTWSPDNPPVRYKGNVSRVSFRGPCARHDMAIEKIAKGSGSVKAKRSKRGGADKTFRGHMYQNCNYEFWGSASRNKGLKSKCRSLASVYYTVVDKRTKLWNGKLS